VAGAAAEERGEEGEEGGEVRRRLGAGRADGPEAAGGEDVGGGEAQLLEGGGGGGGSMTRIRLGSRLILTHDDSDNDSKNDQ
jgi:hypothetical protein